MKERIQLSTEEAIRIAKIVCQAPEERLPLVVEILQKSNITLESITELYEWRALKNQTLLLDITDFHRHLIEHFQTQQIGDVRIRATEFTKYCLRLGVKPALAKKALLLKGYIETRQKGTENDGTSVIKVNGEPIRFVLLRRTPAY